VIAAMPIPEARGQRSAANLHLLDVPYLAQSESLCGGAALAMLMRYWGAANVYAETFANLVEAEAGGIRTADLVGALRSRGWTAQSVRGNAASVQHQIAARRPVILLIQDRPGRFHYVVVVGWAGGRVVVHDPARGPFRILDEHVLAAAWLASDNWTLIAEPPASMVNREDMGSGARSPDRDVPGGGAEPCGDLIDEGVRLARTDDKPGARRLLEIAAAKCPESAGPWREMAGLHALGSEWPAAADDARRALSKDPSDALAARILATALYLDERPDDALEAWNRVGEPIIDLINVNGLERTRYSVAARLMGLEPKTLLTRSALIAARRRLSELPSAQTTSVALKPEESGRTQVEASVIERPLWPTSAVSLGAMGLHGITDREAVIRLSSPTGGGEAWTFAWRWWEQRPKLALGFDAAAPFGGVWGVTLFDERQTYQSGEALAREARRRADLHVSNWTTWGMRWEGTAGIDRFNSPDASVHHLFALSGAVQQRFDNDRGSVEARAGSWFGDASMSTFALRSEWRSSVRHEGMVWMGRAEGALVGASAPPALWPGAGTGQGREGLLRAHPLIDDGIIRDAVFGRRAVDGGFETTRWIQSRGVPVHFGPALFVDVARAYRGLDPAIEGWQTDVGAGLRVAIPGSGVLRIDVAHGLRDGRTVVSMGWGR
jgi:hypothetical protein